MADYTTLAQIKARIPITSASAGDDSFLSALITRASAIIDSYTDQHFTAVSATRYFDVPQRNLRRLLLDDWLISCTSVTNGNGVVIPAAEYILEDKNSPPYYAIVLKRVSSYFFMGDSGFNSEKCIAVAGNWGWSTVAPYDIVECCERLVVASYRSRGGEHVSGQTTITPAGVTETAMVLTNDVKELLSNYRKIVLSVGASA